MSEDPLRSELHKLLESADTGEQIGTSGEGAARWMYQQASDWDLRDAPEKAAARRKSRENTAFRERWLNHPISHPQRKRLRNEIQRFFRAYYKELRTEVARRENASDTVPPYLKGCRKIITYFCWDGVLIVHKPADEQEAEEDVYGFIGAANRVTDVAAVYNPPKLGGEHAKPLILYPNDADLDPFYYPDPRLAKKWTRMDFASLNNLHTWRNEEEARQQAQAHADHSLTGF